MKKFIAIIIVITITFGLCSCGNKQTYVKQDSINLNYNNITTGGSLYITNDVICSVEHNFGFDLYVIDTEGKHKITTLSYGYGTHINNDKLFYCDDGFISGFEFFEYDLATEKRQKIASTSAERICSYFVVDDILYLETGYNDTLKKDIVMISLDTGEQNTVEKDIFKCGIVDNKLNYITKNKNEYSIFEYDTKSGEKSLLGKFELEKAIYEEDSFYANFNSEYITLVSKDETKNESEIYIYKYDDNSLIKYNFKGVIRYLVAYDKYAFIRADGKVIDDSVTTEIIYRLNIENLTTEKIVELNGYNELFVGSDDKVFVTSTDFEGVRRYSMDGSYENVILN